MWALAVVTLAVLAPPLAHAACSAGSIDLSAIPAETTPLTIEQQITGEQTTSTHQWFFSICTPMQSPPGYPTCAQNGAGYVTEFGVNPLACETTWNTITSSYAMQGSDVVVTYGETGTSNRPTWTMQVTLTCGSTAQLQKLSGTAGYVTATLVGFETYAFAVTLSTAVVCAGPLPPPPSPPTAPPPTAPGPTPSGPTPSPTPPGPTETSTPPSSGGCGGGCAFVIIIFVGGFVYVVITVLVYYCVQGKRGKELLPHPGFWGALPGLIKDGVLFIVSKLRGLCGGGTASGSYQTV